MPFTSVLACALLSLTPSLATAQDPEPRDLASVTENLELEIEKILEETGIPSISIALIREGQVAWTNAYGLANVKAKVPATPNTYYSTGSTFKFVTATAVVQLVENEKLTLDTPLNEIVGSEFAIADADDVTIRHLLSHHSGLDAYSFARRINTEGPVTTVPLWSRRPSITPGEILSNTRRVAPPGVKFKYSNDGYAILSYVIDDVARGESFDSYVAKHVLQPLGIDIERPSVPSATVVELMALPYELVGNSPRPVAQVRYDGYAAGDAYLRASDMARFIAAHLNGGEYAGNRILGEESAAEMRRQQFEGRGYGLGVNLASFDGRDLIHHSGSIPGFYSYMVAEPATRQGVYIMSNGRLPARSDERAVSPVSELGRHAMQLMWGNEVEPLPSFAVEEEDR